MTEEIRPDYYKHPSGIDTTRLCEGLDFNIGTTAKYIIRAGLKPGESFESDISKAITYVGFDLLIDHPKRSSSPSIFLNVVYSPISEDEFVELVKDYCAAELKVNKMRAFAMNLVGLVRINEYSKAALGLLKDFLEAWLFVRKIERDKLLANGIQPW